MTVAPAFQIAGGIILGHAGLRALGLRGLGATAEECERWRRIAGWAVPATDAERLKAAAAYNAKCRQASGALTDSQRAALWLQTHQRPRAEDYPAWVIPALRCGPLDGDCLECSRRVLRYNRVAVENARRRFRKDLCEWNCYRSRAVGRPELCRDCRQYDPLPLPARPACGGSVVKITPVGGDYQIPVAGMTPSGGSAAESPTETAEASGPSGSSTGPPRVTLVNLSGGSPVTFRVGERFRLSIAGQPNQEVKAWASHNGSESESVFGRTDAAGRWSIEGQMGAEHVGQWTQRWYVGGVQATPELRFAVVALEQAQGETGGPRQAASGDGRTPQEAGNGGAQGAPASAIQDRPWFKDLPWWAWLGAGALVYGAIK